VPAALAAARIACNAELEWQRVRHLRGVVPMIDWVQLNLTALLQVVMIDLVLAADNAVIVGLAASRVAPELRNSVVFWGIAGAVALRIAFAVVAASLLNVVGLLAAGGFLLLWVCWKMYWELTHAGRKRVAAHGVLRATGESVGGHMSFAAAVTQIVAADVSMSLDNVLAVAGAAKGDPWVLIVGLGIAIVLMAVAANAIANVLARFPWIAWIGWAVILYVALEMIYVGWQQACEPWGIACPPDIGGWVRGMLGR
jgi:YjbE family integral membrane protein